MILRPFTRFALAALLAIPNPAKAQSPGVAIRDALRAQTHGPGGCWEALTTEPARLFFFPAERFVRGICLLEHGDTATAIVGIDSDSVLYVGGSQSSLGFLLRRHPPSRIDSTSVLAYVRQALEIIGEASGHAVLVTSLRDAPRSASDAIAKRGAPLLRIETRGTNAWELTLVLRAPGGYYQPAVYEYRVLCLSSGEIYVDSRRLVWSDPNHA